MYRLDAAQARERSRLSGDGCPPEKIRGEVTEVWMRRSRTATARVMARIPPARSSHSVLIYDLERAVDLYAFAAQSSDVGAFLQSPFSLR
jgi:hypothetical protein